MKSARYVVVFKNTDSVLACMFIEKYATVEKAKAAIEEVAKHYAEMHALKGKKHLQKLGWVKPKTEDYYHVKACDGAECIWQYFSI